MKVLVFSNMYPTQDKPQFGIYVYNQVQILEEMGCTCKVISLKSKGNKYLRYLDFFLRSLFYSLIRGKEYAIVHAHYAFPPGLFALIHKKRFHSKMIVTTHGSDINKMPEKSPKVAFLIGKVLKNADKIVCVSENLQEKILQRFDVKSEKIKIINMGINTQIFHKIEGARRELNLPDDKKIFLFVGNFYKAKGVLDLLEAFQNILREDKLLILLGDPKVELDTTKVIEERTKGDPRVILIPPQPQAVVAKYMNGANVFVLPSYSEGYSLVTYEAMATETLVVLSDIDVFEYLKEDTVMKAKPGDVASLQLALENSMDLDDPTTYTTNGLEIAMNNSAREKSMEIFKMYNE